MAVSEAEQVFVLWWYKGQTNKHRRSLFKVADGMLGHEFCKHWKISMQPSSGATARNVTDKEGQEPTGFHTEPETTHTQTRSPTPKHTDILPTPTCTYQDSYQNQTHRLNPFILEHPASY